jgi:putative SOS response-associated peptidase YedK
MIPHFAESLAAFKGLATINARADSPMNGAMWRVPLQRRHCLNPLTAFMNGKTGRQE